MKVLAFPRDRANPYQDLLYGALAAEGVTADYLPMVTASQTLNLLLLPALLARFRLRGFRILHLHWTYLFAPAWVRAVPGGRRVLQAWFSVVLAAARLLGYRLVWTAHNVLPLSRVFADDVAARRTLIRAADAVVAHNAASVAGLEAFGARDVRVVPMGPYAGLYPVVADRASARRRLGLPEDERVALLFGVLEAYKGVDLLLEAARRLPGAVRLRVVVAGRCPDAAYRQRLLALAEGAERVTLSIGHVPDGEVQAYFAAADAAVLPFRRITNSSSLLLALAFGLPVVIPSLPELAEVPDDVAFRYPPGEAGLASALGAVASAGAAALAAMSAKALAYTEARSWERCAEATASVYRSVLAAGAPALGTRSRERSAP